MKTCAVCGERGNTVPVSQAGEHHQHGPRDHDFVGIDAFTRGYLECALWLTDPEPGSGEWSEHDDWTIANLNPDNVRQAIDDCHRFQTESQIDLDEIDDDLGRDAAHAGHDFYLSRNGHGTGFFDRGSQDVWRRLQDAARAYGTAFGHGEIDDNGQLSLI
jgi:hypothetical protein